MSRKPNFAKDIDELTERTDQNLLRLLDHAKRDDKQTQVASSPTHNRQPSISTEPADVVGEHDKPTETAPS